MRQTGSLPRWARGLLGAARDPVVWVFLLAGTFEILTGDPRLHATLLFAVAAVLIVDAIRRRVQGPDHSDAPGGGAPPAVGGDRLPVPHAGWLAVAGIAFAVAVGSLRRYAGPATVSVWVVGAAGVAWAWRVPSRHRAEQPLPLVGAVAWVVVFAGFALWEFAALLFQPSLMVNSPDHPTLSTLSDPFLAHPAGRILGLAVWLAVGWYLVER